MNDHFQSCLHFQNLLYSALILIDNMIDCQSNFYNEAIKGQTLFYAAFKTKSGWSVNISQKFTQVFLNNLRKENA